MWDGIIPLVEYFLIFIMCDLNNTKQESETGERRTTWKGALYVVRVFLLSSPKWLTFQDLDMHISEWKTYISEWNEKVLGKSENKNRDHFGRGGPFQSLSHIQYYLSTSHSQIVIVIWNSLFFRSLVEFVYRGRRAKGYPGDGRQGGPGPAPPHNRQPHQHWRGKGWGRLQLTG